MAVVTPISADNFSLQLYNAVDENLFTVNQINTFFTTSSCIEFFVYDLSQNVLYDSYNFNNYQVLNSGDINDSLQLSQFVLDPEGNVNGLGYSQGEYVAYYNFLNKQIGDVNEKLFISEISSDRTEIALKGFGGLDINLISQTKDFIAFRAKSTFFIDFYLNFGLNDLIIANNIKLEDEFSGSPSVVVKLYEPLPLSFELRDTAWIVTELSEPVAFKVNSTPEPVSVADFNFIQGPNFSIPVKDQVNNSSQNLSYTDIISGASTGSQNQINSLLKESSINISVDYTKFSDFINFSSAQTRIENFYYKVGLIETYTSQSNSLANTTGSSTSKLIVDNKTSNVIKNFDKFEYFMYYSSGSVTSYPKTTLNPPYELYSTTSPQVLTWLGSENIDSSYFGGLMTSSGDYDNANPNQLKKSIPEYLRENSANRPYDLFVDMVAQYYDNVWLYTKDITQKYNADNRLDFGVSKDLVADAIRDFGLKLYQNNFSNQELYTAFLGMTPNNSLFPFPEITGSMPAPTGYEFVDTLISASNDVISMDDTNKSLYKRIYHNIPYLLKSKGTLAGLRALITSYGIPDTILKISEFGGKDQVNANDWDLYSNNFNYAFNTTNNFISSSWGVNGRWFSPGNTPSTVQFRFKAEQFPITNASQSLWIAADGISDPIELRLEYNGSGLTSGSYNGSTLAPDYQYATLRLLLDPSNASVSSSVYLPFFDGGWWSTMITRNSDTFSLFAGNKIYNGNDGTSLGYYSSSSVSSVDSSYWTSANKSYFATSSILNPTTHPALSGSLQEIRYYNTQISESVFKDYVMNPLSFEGNGINSAPDQLVFRAALGSELDISTTSSIHPKITGSWAATQSFSNNSNFYFYNTPSYYKNTEYFFLDQPAAGIKNRTTDKIRNENNTLASGSVLSPIRSLAQNIEASASYTDNINYLEVAFSPQNQINDDIIGQLGHFNIGDYIGDPRQRSSSAQIYPDLNELNEEYFKKYIKQYDLVDFVRLIKFFDNSLFKMIKDFIPVRTSLASGLVIKQHLLERNKYPQPQVSTDQDLLYTGSINMVTISGGAAGVFNQFNSTTTSPLGSLGQGPNNNFPITQSWSVTTPSVSGSVTTIHDSQDEFYNGELSGSVILVTDGELNEHCEQFKNPAFVGVNYKVRTYSDTITGQNLSNFINVNNHPVEGYISTWYGDTPGNPLAAPFDGGSSAS